MERRIPRGPAGHGGLVNRRNSSQEGKRLVLIRGGCHCPKVAAATSNGDDAENGAKLSCGDLGATT